MNKQFIKNVSKVYIYLIIFSILPLLHFSFNAIRTDQLLHLLFWTALTVAAECKSIMIPMPNETSEITLSFAVHLTILMIWGPKAAILVSILSTVIVEIFFMKKSLEKALFNAGQYGLTLLVSGQIFTWLKMSPDHVLIDLVYDMPAFLVSVTCYIFLNTFFIAAVIALTSGFSFLDIFMEDFRIITGYFYALAPISLAAALVYNPRRPYVVLIMIPPLIMADQALRRYYSLHRETQETLTLLAEIVDKRDKCTAAHSTRVSKYAKKIALHLNLPSRVVNEIETAGLVHDLGKIAIEGSILNKNGKLTDEEYSLIKNHPETAFQLLRKLTPYKRGSEYVLYHHERVDGKGYPCGLTSHSIPLGAKILAVADSYDAMTSDRPYRKALPKDVAIHELKKHSNTQFDAKIVDAFIEILEKHEDLES